MAVVKDTGSTRKTGLFEPQVLIEKRLKKEPGCDNPLFQENFTLNHN